MEEIARATPPRRRYALLAAALAIPLLFDRLFVSGSISDGTTLFQAWGCWCALITLIGAALFAVRARRTALWWITGVAALAMSVWLMTVTAQTAAFRIPPANLAYAITTATLVLPATLMAFLQLSSGTLNVHRPSELIVDWLRGWTLSWFTHWPVLARTCSDAIALVTGANGANGSNGTTTPRRFWGRIGVALLICAPILVVVVPLLMETDEVFSYVLSRVVSNLDLSDFVMHAMVILVPAPFLFSLLASVETRKHEPMLSSLEAARRNRPFDPLISGIVLGVVLVVYLLFCAIQFTFLFAGHGLPDGYTYAEYARTGFFQLLFVASVNLIGFGVVATYAPRRAPLIGMQIGLIAATGVMLVSAAMRLALYIQAYGLTWLRYLSMTFIVALAITLVLALVRLFVECLPLITIALALLLAWWLIIGFANPDNVIDTWNITYAAPLCV
ncbi:DUF4153 domain-containing protein [Bifidobacterium eulemuris]|nr:DUF4173 domain-containing protein [Bifidobacterium eulemuris]